MASSVVILQRRTLAVLDRNVVLKFEFAYENVSSFTGSGRIHLFIMLLYTAAFGRAPFRAEAGVGSRMICSRIIRHSLRDVKKHR